MSGSLKLSDVSFSYGGSAVFKRFSLELQPGINVFTGPSGCGKTTLLKLISNNLRPSSGRLHFSPEKALMLVQEDSLLPWLTGLRNIELFASARLAGDCTSSHPTFPIVSEFVTKRAWQMSYGQRRAVELVRALIADPDILCLDEPFNYIDPVKRGRFSNHLSAGTRASQFTLITTHEISDFRDPSYSFYEFDGQLPVESLTKRQSTGQ